MAPLRFAIRQLARAPFFSAVAVVTLSLGIGASTLIFSVVDGVLLEPLPYPQADRIVRIFEVNDRSIRVQVADPNFADLKAQNRSFAALAELDRTDESVVGGSEPVRVQRANVSSEFFDMIGVVPALGRTFLPEELRQGGAPAALVSYGYWQRYLGGAPDFASRTLEIAGTIHSIVGVMPQGFDFPRGTDVWTPREIWPVLPARNAHNWEVYGRLAGGVSLAEAHEDLGTIAARLKTQYGDDTDMRDAAVVPLRDVLVGGARPAIFALGAAVMLLLMVSCTNVVGLLLARAVTREQEFAVRVALGAGRRRLAGQFFAETVVLCGLACALGLLLAAWGVDLVVALQAGALPRVEAIHVDWRAAVFAAGLGLLIAVSLSVFVAWRAFAGDVVRGANRRGAVGGHRSRLRDGLVATQVAMALVLVIGAVLLGRSFVELTRVDPGFRTDGVVFMNLALPRGPEGESDAAGAAFYAALIERLRALPGVESVGGTNAPPLAGGQADGTFVELAAMDEVESFADFGALAKNPERAGWAEFRIASEGYFPTMGIPLLAGRLFAPSDGPDAAHVAVISRSLAERQWPGRDPIGKLIEFGNMDGDLTPFTIVGIVGDVRDYGLAAELRPTFYGYYRQRPGKTASFWVAIRAPNPETIVPLARGIVRSMNSELPPEFRTADELYAASLVPQRFNLSMLGAFGIATLLLALSGIYGAMTFTVAQRRREIGVRIALGAQESSVVGLVVRKSLVLAGIGIAAGLVLALAGARLISSLLFGIAPHDPVTFVATAAGLLCAALLAAWVPARRAAAVDPIVVLRQE